MKIVLEFKNCSDGMPTEDGIYVWAFLYSTQPPFFDVLEYKSGEDRPVYCDGQPVTNIPGAWAEVPSNLKEWRRGDGLERKIQ